MPTDAEWGRLYEFNAVGDAGLIMPPRSYYYRNFVPGGWTDITLGMIYANCGNSGDTSALVAERLASTTPANLFHFGLTNAGNITGFNVASNPNFVGLRGILNSTTQVLTATKEVTFIAPTQVANGVTSLSGNNYSFNLTEGVTGTPYNMIGIRLIHNPLTGILCLNRAVSNGIALADEAANLTTLKAFLTGISNNVLTPNASFTLASTNLLKSFYTFWPYNDNRLKLHCVGVVKLG